MYIFVHEVCEKANIFVATVNKFKSVYFTQMTNIR